MSYLERTAKKLLPILNEVKKRMVKEKKRSSNILTEKATKLKNKVETLEINDDISISDNSFSSQNP